jgi:hypothetical protein
MKIPELPKTTTFEQRQEIKRVNATGLPTMIGVVAGLTLGVGIFVIALSLLVFPDVLRGAGLMVGFSSMLTAPFLYGFSDIVRSLRTMAAQSLK